MAVATTGRFSSGKHKGWKWEIYQDDRSPTGWVRKIWNPTDASNGGKPTEFFDNYDYEADTERSTASEAKSQQTAAQRAADRQALANRQDAADRQREAELDRSYGDKDKDRSSRETIERNRLGSSEREGAADRASRIREIEVKLKEDRRQFDLRYGLDREEIGLKREQLGLQRAELGADIIKTNASMRGPLDAFQGFGAAQGYTNSGLSRFVGDLQGAGVPGFGGGTGGPNPTPLTVGTLAAELTGQPTTGTDAYGRPILTGARKTALDAIDAKYQQGLANQGLGFKENMTKNQLAAFTSGGDYIGRDTDSEWQYYARSRPGQGSSLSG